VVSAGLLISRRSSTFLSPSARIQIWSARDALIFVLNGLVFVLMGLQLHTVCQSIRGYSLSTLALYGAVFSGLLILLRLLWVYPGAIIAWFVRTRFLHHNLSFPPARYVFVVGWTGMRGVVSLAAALALPAILADGTPFPHTGLLVYLTFAVIFVTLVLQGLTLPPLIRAMGLAGAAEPDDEEREARRIIARTVIAHLEGAKGKDNQKFFEIYHDLMRRYSRRLATLQAGDDGANHAGHAEVTAKVLRIERATAIRLRDEGRINDEVLRRIERELDMSESQVRSGITGNGV
jgi:monovalent cation/hydrogen antiporter